MSLKTLMIKEITHDDFQKLNRFLDIVQTDDFTNELLEQHFSEEKYKSLVDWIITTSSKTTIYDCIDENEDDLILEEDQTTCTICRQEVTNSTTHDFTVSYCFPEKEITNMRTEIKDLKKVKYLTNSTLINLENLKSEKSSAIPFVGAGLSVPLGLPDWTNLLEQLVSAFSEEFERQIYLRYTSKGDLENLFKGLDFLLSESDHITKPEQLKDAIVEIIKKSSTTNTESHKHNIYDLLKLQANLYITTNYDLSLVTHLSRNEYRSPLCIDDIDNIRKLLQENSQVLHLHGHVDRKETMIISENDYKELYTSNQQMSKLAAIIANRPFMFVGFSFKDEFFTNMYDKLSESFTSEHYIIVANPDREIVRTFKQKNIKVIGLNLGIKDGRTNYDDYIYAFRFLIEYILE